MNAFIQNPEYTQSMHTIMPYSQFLGLQMGMLNNNIGFHLPFHNNHVGNTIRVSLHGGLLGGLLQSCAQMFVYAEQNCPNLPQILDINIDYLRPGQPKDCYISCKTIKQGSTLSSIWVEIFHHDVNKPVASARVQILLP